MNLSHEKNWNMEGNSTELALAKLEKKKLWGQPYEEDQVRKPIPPEN